MDSIKLQERESVAAFMQEMDRLWIEYMVTHVRQPKEIILGSTHYEKLAKATEMLNEILRSESDKAGTPLVYHATPVTLDATTDGVRFVDA